MRSPDVGHTNPLAVPMADPREPLREQEPQAKTAVKQRLENLLQFRALGSRIDDPGWEIA